MTLSDWKPLFVINQKITLVCRHVAKNVALDDIINCITVEKRSKNMGDKFVFFGDNCLATTMEPIILARLKTSVNRREMIA